MRFQTTPTINYDPHHVITIRRQVNKNKPFEHHEVEGLAESSNWTNYPQVAQNEEDTQQGSTSPMKDDDDVQPDPLVVAPAT